ncbi:MAG TPA: ABC transporter ATP-binding protein [Jiangellaceae bacterium]|nr:ABC transporter ATP-binding protein [Jiangellaceae bacterium]
MSEQQAPLLSATGITKSFAGLHALTDVDVTVPRGHITAIIGPNGAGKTTLFNVIAGAMPPNSGRVVFDGTDITGWPAHRVAGVGLARTFQLMKPFESLSVRDNVLVAAFQRAGRRDEAIAAADSIVERVGLGRWSGQLAGELPTAGRKRLELARALALQPKLLLLDEVLAGLVPAERAPVIELLREIRATGVTMLLVEHVMAAVMALSDEIVVLHHGMVLAKGTPDQVTRDERVIEAYLGEELLIAES